MAPDASLPAPAARALEPVAGRWAELARRPDLLGRLVRHPSLYGGAFILVLFVFIACFAGYLGTVDPSAISPANRTQPPSAEFWFGTDTLGRDLYSRVLFGTRVSLLVGISVACLTVVIGVVVGLVSGYIRAIDGLVMRMMDGLMSIPPVLLAIALMALSRGSLVNVILAIALAEVPRMVRLVRGLVLSIREQTYIESAVANGSRLRTILFAHILPNTVGPVIVQATYVCAAAMVVEALLSFIGVGTPPTTPSWGNIMSEGRALFQVKPYVVLIPAAFLSVAVLAVNMVGDGLRDLLDPKTSKNL